jgi:hypothetical protein
VRKAVAWAAERGVLVAPPTIDVAVDARARSARATVTGVGVALAGDDDAAAAAVVELDAVRASYDRRDGVGVVLDGLRAVSRKSRENPYVFGLWRPLSRSDFSRFGSFLDR